MTTTLPLFLLLGFLGPEESDPVPAPEVEAEIAAPAAEGSEDDELPTVSLEQESEQPDEAHPVAGDSAGGPGPRRRRGVSLGAVSTHGGGFVAAEKGWGFEFNGYLNVPTRPIQCGRRYCPHQDGS